MSTDLPVAGGRYRFFAGRAFPYSALTAGAEERSENMGRHFGRRVAALLFGMILAVPACILLFLALALAAPARAQPYQLTQLDTAAACPLNNFTSLDLPHLTSARDATGQNWIDALVLANTMTTAQAVTVCAFGDHGVFYGGSTITILPNRRLMFVSNSGDAATSLASILLPARQASAIPGSGSGLGGTVPADAAYHLALTNNTNVKVQGGFVGNASQFFMFYNPATYYAGEGNKASGIIPHFGSGGGYYGTCSFANVFTSAATVTVSQRDDAGVVIRSVSLTVPPQGRVALSMADYGFRQFGRVDIDTTHPGIRTLCSYLTTTSAVGNFAATIATPE